MRTLKSLCILALSAMAVLVTSVPVDADSSGWVRTTVSADCFKGVTANLAVTVSTTGGTGSVSCHGKATFVTSFTPTFAVFSGSVNSASVAGTIPVPGTTNVDGVTLTAKIW